VGGERVVGRGKVVSELDPDIKRKHDVMRVVYLLYHLSSDPFPVAPLINSCLSHGTPLTCSTSSVADSTFTLVVLNQWSSWDRLFLLKPAALENCWRVKCCSNSETLWNKTQFGLKNYKGLFSQSSDTSLPAPYFYFFLFSILISLFNFY
jgi:hypothetical protein